MHQFDMRNALQAGLRTTKHKGYTHTHKFAKHKTDFRDKVWYWTFGQVPSSLPPQVSPHCHSICLKQSCKFHKYPPARSKHVMRCWIPKKENISNQHGLPLHLLSNNFVSTTVAQWPNVTRPYKNQEDNKPQLSHCNFVAATALNGAMMPMTRRRSRLWVNGSLIIGTGKRIAEDGHHEKRCQVMLGHVVGLQQRCFLIEEGLWETLWCTLGRVELNLEVTTGWEPGIAGIALFTSSAEVIHLWTRSSWNAGHSPCFSKFWQRIVEMNVRTGLKKRNQR